MASTDLVRSIGPSETIVVISKSVDSYTLRRFASDRTNSPEQTQSSSMSS